MGVESNLKKDVALLNEQYLTAGPSCKQKILFDFDYVSSLNEQLQCDLKIPDYSIKSDDPTLFMNQIMDYIYALEELAEYVITMYKKMNFYCYQRICFEAISHEKAMALLKEFLEYFLKDLLYIFEDLLKREHFAFCDLGPNLGESYLLNTIKSYYILINQEYYNPVILLETIVHELVHVYSNMFLQNYRSYATANLNNGFFGEALSMYAEISFYEFLRAKKVFGENLVFHRNVLDYSLLKYFKTINYIAKMSARVGTDFYSDNSTYTITGKNHLRTDRGVHFFEYPKAEYAKGNLNDFKYALGGIEAFKFLERERSGENIKKMIDSYLITFQNESQMDDYLSQFHDLSFMYKEIAGRSKELKRNHPLPGYHV